MAQKKRTTRKCEYRNRDFCNDKDVRAVIPRRHDASVGRYFFDGPTSYWCAGCRELNNGGFKYDKSKS